jgi:two-component system invasion response regulator UvrY
MIRVLVADDHAVVRRGLKEVLEESSDIRVVGEASNAQEAMERVKEGAWDVVVLDINLPGRSGLDLLEDIHALRPNLPVLILTIYSEQQYALRALKSGAAGYLTKETAPERLAEAVHKVVGGGRYVTPTLAERLASMVRSGFEGAPHDQLSEREFRVFRLLAAGKTVSQIAGTLHLSVKTISTYRARTLEKLGLATNAELTQYAVRNGLVE